MKTALVTVRKASLVFGFDVDTGNNAVGSISFSVSPTLFGEGVLLFITVKVCIEALVATCGLNLPGKYLREGECLSLGIN